MQRFKDHTLAIFLFVLLFIHPFTSIAQINEHVFYTDPSINPEEIRQLRVEIDNLSFFKNNEFAGEFIKGYTLPGFWIRGGVSYQPLRNLKLEGGIYAMCYWGADKYPNYAYLDIAQWKSDKYQPGMRLLPFFRGQIALSRNVDIILGHIYGGANHGLIEPLYYPELNLTADPEVGLQLLYKSRWVDLDAWVNWHSFIFQTDYHQEAFTVGLSTKVKFNTPESKFHWYIPVQGLAQHRGGEIDTLTVNSVQTLMNGAVGVGMDWNTGHPVFRKVNIEFDAAAYYQQAGELWPFDNGSGFYTKINADIYDFRIKASYWNSSKFISMFGVPYYGAVSVSDPGKTFDDPKMFYFGAEYTRSLGKGYAVGIDLDVFHTFSTHSIKDGIRIPVGSATGFTAGIYLRINPSFLIKTF